MGPGNAKFTAEIARPAVMLRDCQSE